LFKNSSTDGEREVEMTKAESRGKKERRQERKGEGRRREGDRKERQ
jgi:hypothetical protein